jgi:hypothetical protein
MDGIRADSPTESVIAPARVEAHAPALVVASEHTGECPLKGDGRTIEDAVGRFGEIAGNDWITAISPDHIGAIPGAVLPGDIGQWLSTDDSVFRGRLGHDFFSFQFGSHLQNTK